MITTLETAKIDAKSSLLGFQGQQREQPLVGCGHPWLDGVVRIVDPNTGLPCNEKEVGEIWVSGSNISQGYWKQPELTKQTFQAYLSEGQDGPYLRTGDLGFLHQDELFITGRLKEMMIFWGLNRYPQHIEQTVEKCHPAFRPNCGAAFSVSIRGENRLVIAHEIDRKYRDSLFPPELVATIRWRVAWDHYLDVYAIVLLKSGTLPKTSSGKIQRQACRAKFLAGDLSEIYQWQSADIAPSTLNGLIKRYFNPITHLKRYGLIATGKMKRLWYELRKFSD